MMNLDWELDQGSDWFWLDGLNLEPISRVEGVYVIAQGNALNVIYVGSSEMIGKRLNDHCNDPKIAVYSNLVVTWASVGEPERLGVERFLAERLDPAVGHRYPENPRIAVNLPPGFKTR